MNIQDFFNSSALLLPRTRPNSDFVMYLRAMFNDYERAVDSLNKGCHLCDAVRARKPEIQQTARWVCGAVDDYLEGSPSKAYTALEHGLNNINQQFSTLFSIPISNDVIAPLYRIAVNGLVPSKARLFHCPMNLRHKVKQHRYGIPGFPCLYLGGSLQVCQLEGRIKNADLPQTIAAEFAVRSPVKLLNFAYRPSVLSTFAAMSAGGKPGANPQLEQYLVDYATCWPLLAASSLQVLHDQEPFVYEYIVPQMIMQWIMNTTDCDGIRYFSTRLVPPLPTFTNATTNYVFPAKRPWNKQDRSQPLVNKFSFTDYHQWRSTTGGMNLNTEYQDNTHDLAAMPKNPI